MAQRMRVHESSSEEGNRLLRLVRRSFGSVVRWGRAQMVLLPAQGMDVAAIAGREGFIVEQLVDEFTWSKPLGDSRSVRQPL